MLHSHFGYHIQFPCNGVCETGQGCLQLPISRGSCERDRSLGCSPISFWYPTVFLHQSVLILPTENDADKGKEATDIEPLDDSSLALLNFNRFEVLVDNTGISQTAVVRLKSFEVHALGDVLQVAVYLIY